MFSLYASIRNEAVKIALQKKAVFFLAAMIGIPVLAGLLLANVQSGFGIGTISAEDFPITMLGWLTSLLLPLCMFMLAADLFAGEVGDRTLKLVLTRPVHRFKIFASKQIALAVYIGLCLAAALLASAVSALFFHGAGGAQAMLNWLLAYSSAFVPLLVLSMGAVLLAQFFSSSSGALTISILLYLGLKVTAVFFPNMAAYSVASYMDWYMLWIGGTTAPGHLLSSFMFLMACSILFFTAGYFVFDKKEL